MQQLKRLAPPDVPDFTPRKRAAVPLFALIALIVAAFTAPAAQAVPSESPLATWVTDGGVEATAKHGDTLYIGGKFNKIAPRTGPAAAFDATSAEMTSTPLLSASLGGEVEVVAADGEGGYYVGGFFRHAKGEPHQGIVHVLADGSLDPNFVLELRERVEAIALDGETLYVGGRVFEIDGETREGLAAFDASTGELLPWAPEADNEVFALVVHGDYVYVGGKFNNVNGESRHRIAAIQAAGTGAGEGEVTAWHPLPNSEVLALAVSGSTLYAGGKFTQVDSEEHKYLAAFDLSAGSPGEPELSSWAPAGSSYVAAIAPSEDGETVYVGGEFTQMNGEAHGHLAALEASDGSVVEAWVPSSNYRILSLAVAGSTVYAAGEFSQVNSEERRGVVALEAEGSGALLPWNPDVIGGSVASVVVSGSNVVVGGFFNGANGVARKNLAAIDLSTGEATSWAPEANGEVVSMALTEDGKIAYVGGVFTQVNGESRSRFASIRTEDAGLTAWAPDPNGTPDAIVVDGSRLYLGGGFGYIEGVNTWERLAAFEIEGEGATVVSAWRPKPNNSVEALAVDGEKLYVSGYFTQIGGSEHHDVAVLDKGTGVADETWDPEPNSRVTSIAVAGSTLFIGGLFTSVDGETRQHRRRSTAKAT